MNQKNQTLTKNQQLINENITENNVVKQFIFAVGGSNEPVRRGIEPMSGCIHGGMCEHLDSKAGERPLCKKANMPVFDVGLCPAGHFGPISPACGSRRG